MGAGAGHVGAERGVAGTLGDAVLHRPQHSVVIIAARGDVGKRHGAGFGLGTAGGTPQEGHGLRTGADAVRGEMGIIGSLRNAVLHRPIHSVLIIAAGGYIHKHAGLGVAVGLHKDDLDGMGSADILKGVGLHRADALAVDLDVGDGIALIWGDGKGLIPTLTDADAAGGRNRAARPGSCLDGVVAVVPTAATAGLVIQLNLAGQGRVVVIIRREAPFVGRVGLDRGIVGQGLALVIHPFQLAVTGIQSASLGGQRRVLQRLAAGGDLGVVRLAGSRAFPPAPRSSPCGCRCCRGS